jgi:hypothetical protein
MRWHAPGVWSAAGPTENAHGSATAAYFDRIGKWGDHPLAGASPLAISMAAANRPQSPPHVFSYNAAKIRIARAFRAKKFCFRGEKNTGRREHAAQC